MMNYIKFISNIRIEDLLVLKEKRKMAKLNIVLFEPEIPAKYREYPEEPVWQQERDFI